MNPALDHSRTGIPTRVGGAPARVPLKLLVVDDEEMVRQVLVETLTREGYEVRTAADGIQGLECVQKETFAAILSDHHMPRMRGLDFLAKARELQPRATRILITGVVELETVLDAINRGELYRFIIKPWIREELLVTLKNALQRYELVEQNEILQAETQLLNEQLKQVNVHLEKQLRRELDQNKELERLNQMLRESLQHSVQLCLKTLETFYPTLGSQARRMKQICQGMASVLQLDDQDRETLELAAQLCDIGLLGVPRDLIKRWQRSGSSLTDAEQAMLRQHPVWGQELVRSNQRFAKVGELIRWHHEQLDGRGYPDGLVGDQIPWLARLLGVAAAYADAGGNEAALMRVKRESGVTLDSEAVRVFFRCIPSTSLPKGQREVLLQELRPGMVLARGVYTANGLLLIPEGEQLSSAFIDKLLNHHRVNPIKHHLLVYC